MPRKAFRAEPHSASARIDHARRGIRTGCRVEGMKGMRQRLLSLRWDGGYKSRSVDNSTSSPLASTGLRTVGYSLCLLTPTLTAPRLLYLIHAACLSINTTHTYRLHQFLTHKVSTSRRLSQLTQCPSHPSTSTQRCKPPAPAHTTPPFPRAGRNTTRRPGTPTTHGLP